MPARSPRCSVIARDCRYQFESRLVVAALLRDNAQLVQESSGLGAVRDPGERFPDQPVLPFPGAPGSS